MRDDLLAAIRVLEAALEDRSLLASLDHEERQRLMVAAGRLSRPLRKEAKVEWKAVEQRNRAEKEAQDRLARASTGIRAARTEAVFVAPPQLAGEVGEAVPTFANPKACYVCKQRYTQVHFFYDAMCPACAARNYAKRFPALDLSGRVALVTGARLKIGYQASLMLLRMGARVIVTTRFPNDAAARYAREPDHDAWADRLQIFGLDLRHSPSVEILCRYLVQTLPRLDLLINNAAQTVRRPTAYYRDVAATERAASGAGDRRWLRAHDEIRGLLQGASAEASPGEGLLVPWGGGPGIGLVDSAQMSQIPCTWDDVTTGADLFPEGRFDADLQQVDLRVRNTWRLTLAEVPIPEAIEVHLVNAIAPFVLCSRLKPILLRSPDVRHIVNVSAMEGVFARGTKTDKHPHTNMAKAALNMMTLTSAPDYARDGIFMNAVDTGWVTDEDPLPDVERKQRTQDFQPPLDIVDGAARILDPYLEAVRTGESLWGKFLKDYDEHPW